MFMFFICPGYIVIKRTFESWHFNISIAFI